MMVPLSGTSTGSAGKASPHLQAWLDKKKAAEEKQRVLEGIPEEKKGLRARVKAIFRPMSYPKEEWEADRKAAKDKLAEDEEDKRV